MSVTLSDEHYGAVFQALTRIACGRFGPNSQRISRDAAMTMAREACDAVGWTYGKDSISGQTGARERSRYHLNVRQREGET